MTDARDFSASRQDREVQSEKQKKKEKEREKEEEGKRIFYSLCVTSRAVAMFSRGICVCSAFSIWNVLKTPRRANVFIQVIA